MCRTVSHQSINFETQTVTDLSLPYLNESDFTVFSVLPGSTVNFFELIDVGSYPILGFPVVDFPIAVVHWLICCQWPTRSFTHSLTHCRSFILTNFKLLQAWYSRYLCA